VPWLQDLGDTPVMRVNRPMSYIPQLDKCSLGMWAGAEVERGELTKIGRACMGCSLSICHWDEHEGGARATS
jgi:hypothetical protein